MVINEGVQQLDKKLELNNSNYSKDKQHKWPLSISYRLLFANISSL